MHALYEASQEAVAYTHALYEALQEAIAYTHVLLGCLFSVYALGRPFLKPIANLVQMSFCM